MLVILGVILLVAAVVTGVTGVVVNSDEAHALTDDFSLFGYAVTGSTATLFALGIAVGAAGALGLAMIVAATSRERRRRLAARGELRDVRAEADSVKAERDDLLARVDSENTARVDAENAATEDAARLDAERAASENAVRGEAENADTTATRVDTRQS